MKKKTKKITKKCLKKAEKLITLGNIKPQKARILFLLLAIVFIETFMLVPKYVLKNEPKEIVKASAPSKRNPELEKQIKQLVKGYPIESMVPYIVNKDEKVAAFMISIAKKESNWGVRRPVLDGENCYNYWGFRLKSERMGSGGHTCFDSPKEAVDTVATRIDQLVKEEEIDTPKEMVVWKCGYDCTGSAAVGANKWIKDVDYYYSELIN